MIRCWRGGLLLWCLLATVAVCQSNEPDTNDLPEFSLLQRLREARLGTQTMAVRFTQTKRLALLDVTLTSEGWMIYQSPESIRYEMISPIRSLLMNDGKKVRNYAYSEGQWRKLRNPAADAVGKVMSQIGHWLQGDFDSDQKMFSVGVAPDEKGVGAIVLTPQQKALKDFIQRIELRVEALPDLCVTRVLMHESAEDVTELTFQQEHHNVVLPPGTFVSPDVSEACEALFQEAVLSDPNTSSSCSS